MFEWKTEYAVNIPSVDTQHQGLFAIGRELHLAMCTGKGNAVLSPILDKLVKYTVQHFNHEEILMRSNQYPGFVQHKAEHDALVKKVLAFQADFNSGRSALPVQVLQFIKEWLEHHIKKSD